MKVTIRPRLLFYVLLIVHCIDGYQSKQIIFKLFPGQSLEGNVVVKTLSVETLLECGERCAERFPQCKSFNYRQGGKLVNKFCEINNTTKRSQPETSLIEDAEWTYGQILSPNFEESTPTIAEPEPLIESQLENGLYHSKILNENVEFIAKLMEWLDNKSKWTLCWRASEHGWRAPTFHGNCDYKTETVTIVSVDSGNYIFGGYSDLSWEGYYRSFSSSSAFLFSLRNNDGLEPFKSSMNTGWNRWAIYQGPYYGPSFGEDGHELYIPYDVQSNTCSANFGKVFELPPGYTFNTIEAKALLGGSDYFYANEIETYYLADN